MATEVARNEAVGQFTNLGVGLGTMAGVGGAVAGTVGGAMNDALNQTNASNNQCAKCGAPLPQNAKFCLECGEKVATVMQDNTVICPSCGKTVAKGKFCPECGYKFITACPSVARKLCPAQNSALNAVRNFNGGADNEKGIYVLFYYLGCPFSLIQCYIFRICRVGRNLKIHAFFLDWVCIYNSIIHRPNCMRLFCLERR